MEPSPRNQTIRLCDEDRERLRPHLMRVEPGESLPMESIQDAVIPGDFFALVEQLPAACVDLLFVDPPYNLNKQFGDQTFRQMSLTDYAEWLDDWLGRARRLLKPDASIYICGDWRSSSAIHMVCEKHFIVQNRITFEREKGRGARNGWKNSSEDIWFCTMSRNYYFDAEAVKLKRRVIAPYRLNGVPRDWQAAPDGSNYRMTYPSNLWTDITVPFWSMPENTPHPNQKSEKLMAKLLLASSRPGDLVLDPFAGAGTTGAAAFKLGRRFTLVEIEEEYCLYALRRLEMARESGRIQGYSEGVFWERNAFSRATGQARAKNMRSA